MIPIRTNTLFQARIEYGAQGNQKLAAPCDR